jgi:aminomethyltransferase
VLLNETGGIIDDTIITKQESSEHFYVVTNAGRIDKDKEHIGKALQAWNAKQSEGDQVIWETLDGWGLLALQGPKAAEVLQGLVGSEKDLSMIKFGQSAFVKVGKDAVECHIARGGYTGEDGFEVGQPKSRNLLQVKQS